ITARAFRQRELLQLLLEHPGGISADALRAEGGDPALLKSLQLKGLAQSFEHHPDLPHADITDGVIREAPLTLHDEQAQAVEAIRA
ncbi:hypothetical protein, partial [Klebsiella quasipneumoniae]|uniref:hypothetical protein n=1 Tax=Klebsiella quasipneumoniae TaxID=1463165 RepID=UPI00272FCC42